MGTKVMLLNIAVCTIGLMSVNAALPENYVSLPAEEKLRVLWSRVSQNPYSLDSLPTAPVPPAYLAANAMNTTFLQTSFTWTDDEMPPGRIKAFHRYGSVCKVKLDIHQQSPFTGIFSTGGVGVIRMSQTAVNDSSVASLALKILIDKQKSENLVLFTSGGVGVQAMHKNYFAKTMRNFIAAPEPLGAPLIPIFKAFQTAVFSLPGGPTSRPEDFNIIPLKEAASVGSDGENVSVPVVPYIVTFRPNPALAYDENDITDYRLQMAKIAEGTLLYTVSVTRFDEYDSTVIGTLTSQSQVMATPYADEVLFFQHSRTRSIYT